MIKLTTELEAGDVIVFADQRDTVLSVKTDGSDVARVNVLRNGASTFFYAGIYARHTIAETPSPEAVRAMFTGFGWSVTE